MKSKTLENRKKICELDAEMMELSAYCVAFESYHDAKLHDLQYKKKYLSNKETFVKEVLDVIKEYFHLYSALFAEYYKVQMNLIMIYVKKKI
jgi:phage terminase small subunit